MVLTDRAIAGLAATVFVSALIPLDLGGHWRFVGVAIALVGVRTRAVALLLLGLATACSVGAGSAIAEANTELPADIDGYVTLLSDPVPTRGGVRFDARSGGERIELRAWGSAAGHLRSRLMGERVRMKIAVRPLLDPPTWVLARGVRSRGSVSEVSGFKTGSTITRVANSVRRTIESGADSMTRRERSLFTGLVYGDDRLQSPLTVDNFRAAGLTHLLAVSGQNVAFALAIVGPILRRLERRGRFALTLLVLLVFATVTRFEPSVLRASVMSAIAALGALTGNPLSSRRGLGLTVIGLIVVDPLLAHQVAFQLSVAASAGILAWSKRLASALPGPRTAADLFAVTASAQLAVAPLLVLRFGGIPVASLPANLLAGPIAGPVMMWGLTVGWLAGLLPEVISAVVHAPTRAALWWIDHIGALSAKFSLGELAIEHVVSLFAVCIVGIRHTAMTSRAVVVGLALAVLLHPAMTGALRTVPLAVPIEHVELWRDTAHTVVLIERAANPEEVLAGLRRSRVGAIDLLVVTWQGPTATNMVDWVEARHHLSEIWAPSARVGRGAVVPTAGTRLKVGGSVFEVSADKGVLEVEPVAAATS